MPSTSAVNRTLDVKPDSPSENPGISLLQMLGSASLLPVQAVINQLVYTDPTAAAAMARFEDKVLAIFSKSPDAHIQIHFQESGLQMSFCNEQLGSLAPDVTVTAKSADLLSLLLTSDKDRALANPAISIAGDGQLLQGIFQTVRGLDVDIGGRLAPFLGDTLSHQVEIAGAKGKAWSSELKSRMDRNVTDYVQEEARLSPTRSEVNNFYNDLDSLVFALDRVEARIHKLESKTDEEASS